VDEYAGKRLMDLFLASFALVATSPIWLAAALTVRVTSGGPVLYAGERVGKDGRLFRMYKFRTMRRDADRMGSAVTGAGDPRVTAVGRVLRATKLDELPQLLNVLRGEMSLVGPRPEAPTYVAEYDERQRRVLRVRPGITGPTQLLYRHEEAMLDGLHIDELYRTELLPRKLESDLWYLEHQSMRLDLRVLARTAARLVSTR
jgi:lipopolysaccharide/colanic/teichoic acid biosynthesis glycosyltransferase